MSVVISVVGASPDDVIGKDAGGFYVTVGDEIVRFTLDVPGTECNNGQPRPVRTSKEPKILQLKLSWYQPPAQIPVSWIDSATRPLEDQLTDVVVVSVQPRHLECDRSFWDARVHLVLGFASK